MTTSSFLHPSKNTPPRSWRQQHIPPIRYKQVSTKYNIMISRKLDKSKISREARQMLKNGTSRQATFDALSAKHQNTKVISDVIKNSPSLVAINMYLKWNYLLLGLLILSAIFFMLIRPSFGILLWYGLLIYAVGKMLLEYYIWVSVLGTSGIIGLLAISLLSDSGTLKWPYLIIAFGIMVFYIFLPIWIKNHMCPKPDERKEIYTNSQGQPRQRIIYEFKD